MKSFLWDFITGVANRGALRQIWRIAWWEVAHCRFKTGLFILWSQNNAIFRGDLQKKKIKKKVLIWLASRSVAYLGQMWCKRCSETGDDLFFFWRSPLNMALFWLQSIKILLHVSEQWKEMNVVWRISKWMFVWRKILAHGLKRLATPALHLWRIRHGLVEELALCIKSLATPAL